MNIKNENIDEQEISQEELNQVLEVLRKEQSISLAIVASLISSVTLAFIWAKITLVIGVQVGYMAIAVGYIVGHSVRIFGRGLKMVFGIIGALGAVLGCILGNLLSIISFSMQEVEINIGLLDVLFTLLADTSLILELIKESFSPIDLLFYGLAIYFGYSNSFRKL